MRLDADRPLVVDVAELRRHLATQHQLRLAVDLGEVSSTAGSVPPGAEVEVDITLESVPEGVVATGSVSAPWRGDCRRCLTEVTGTLHAPVREVYQDTPDEEAEILPIVDDHLDLGPPVRDAVLLALPLAPLCADACKGLCPSCGTDLNVAECDCVIETADPRWAALSELTFDGDDTGTDGDDTGTDGDDTGSDGDDTGSDGDDTGTDGDDTEGDGGS